MDDPEEARHAYRDELFAREPDPFARLRLAYEFQDHERIAVLEKSVPRCSNCGLLGQLRLADHQLIPMLEEFRCRIGSTGGYLYLLKEEGGEYGGHPICVATERAFTTGSGDAEAYSMGWVQWRDMLHKPMDQCPSFTQWVPGLSIKDHKEMLDRRRMLEWQAGREDADRNWRASESEREDTWRAHQASVERDWRREEREWRADEKNRDNLLRRIELSILGAGVIAAIIVGAIFSSRTTVNNNVVPTPTTQSAP